MGMMFVVGMPGGGRETAFISMLPSMTRYHQSNSSGCRNVRPYSITSGTTSAITLTGHRSRMSSANAYPPSNNRACAHPETGRPHSRIANLGPPLR